MKDIQNKRVLHSEDVAAKRVVDVDLHGGVSAQLDHLPGRAEQEPAQHHHRQLQTRAEELDAGR